mgnify:CR=1 FL=1
MSIGAVLRAEKAFFRFQCHLEQYILVDLVTTPPHRNRYKFPRKTESFGYSSTLGVFGVGIYLSEIHARQQIVKEPKHPAGGSAPRPPICTGLIDTLSSVFINTSRVGIVVPHFATLRSAVGWGSLSFASLRRSKASDNLARPRARSASGENFFSLVNNAKKAEFFYLNDLDLHSTDVYHRPTPLRATRGSAPGPRWGLRPQTPVFSRFALVS